MFLQLKHTIMSWEDLSVQIAGAALFIAALRNEAMPARGAFRSGAGNAVMLRSAF